MFGSFEDTSSSVLFFWVFFLCKTCSSDLLCLLMYLELSWYVLMQMDDLCPLQQLQWFSGCCVAWLLGCQCLQQGAQHDWRWPLRQGRAGQAPAGPLTVAPTPIAAPRRFTASVLGAKAVSRSSSKVSAAFSWHCIFQFFPIPNPLAAGWVWPVLVLLHQWWHHL